MSHDVDVDGTDRVAIRGLGGTGSVPRRAPVGHRAHQTLGWGCSRHRWVEPSAASLNTHRHPHCRWRHGDPKDKTQAGLNPCPSWWNPRVTSWGVCGDRRAPDRESESSLEAGSRGGGWFVSTVRVCRTIFSHTATQAGTWNSDPGRRNAQSPAFFLLQRAVFPVVGKQRKIL